MLAKFGLSDHGYTFALVGLATLSVQWAMTLPDIAFAVPLVTTAILLLTAAVLRRGKLGPFDWSERRHLGPTVLSLFVAWPIVLTVLGSAIGLGQPLETVFLGFLQGIALGLVAIPAARGRQNVLAVAASAFSVAFAVTMSATPAVRALTLAFAGAATIWLGANFGAADQTMMLSANERWRWGRSTSILLGMILLVATAVFARPQGIAARWGWLASSGGTETYDPFARSGVGDGDALVRAEKDASSVAPIADTNVFLATDTPSLYDMFNDMYGEPPKPKHTERAVPLPADLTPREEQQVAISKQAGREFSAIRQPPKRRGLKDRESPAVLHLAGRTPAHLRMTAFDVFDGRHWYPADRPAVPSSLAMQDRSGVPWLKIRSPGRASAATTHERHSLKILALDTATIPLLAETAYLKIDRVTEADYFGWLQEGVIRMAGRERIPLLTVIDLLSDFSGEQLAVVDADRASGQDNSNREKSLPSSTTAPLINNLAYAWTRDCQSPDEQVAAVVGRLRSEFVHDATVVVSPSATDVVAEFLLQEKRGPDYLFASAAAILLRHLGHRTRLVSGFYASPEDYDRRSGLTPVMRDDVHFWAEWRDGSGHWRPLEPTPGYELLTPRMTWSRFLANVAVAIRDHFREHWPVWLVGLTAAVAGYRERLRITDLLTGWTWWWNTMRRPESAVTAALRTLEWRAAIAGCRRDSGCTVHQWLNGMAGTCQISAEARQVFLEHLAVSLYGPESALIAGNTDTSVALQRRRHDCQSFLRAFRAVQMRDHTRPQDRTIRRVRKLVMSIYRPDSE